MPPLSPFQLLLVFSLALQLVSASPKQYFLKYILEPPPCKSEPENCSRFCTQQEECPENLQCCSAYCGIVCASNKVPMQTRKGILSQPWHQSCWQRPTAEPLFL
ncbi:WAP four-disulfide core domain protein 13 [Mesocricetus auratus]|uniref:WAP four-disulfide core domain protein 13 n=1 Tax=Mesocricetus auratus TaxID=10036 RepID=A0A3Q0DFN5_MESAU|nr:WAP four-disulfide core domain protein 13 [Mesocricetus auratus]